MADPGFRWNANAGRYISPAGRFVPRGAVTQALYTATDNSARVMDRVSRQLQNGSISLAEWHGIMRQEVKNVTLYSGAAVKGGWAQMGPADFGRAGQRVREQYKFLDRMAAQIASGEQKLDGRFLNRSSQYGHSGRQTAHLFERVEAVERGQTEERSVLEPGNNCGGCIEEAARGWVPIGELIPIGSRDCLGACHCEYEMS